MPSEAINEATRRDWRELGFYYDRDDVQQTWRLVGSKVGLSRFADALANFAANPKNELQSEHVHLGPYMYLEVGSWPEPQITDHWIAGPLPALRQLASVMQSTLARANIGDVLPFRARFAPVSPYEFQLEVAADDFDPAKADSKCW